MTLVLALAKPNRRLASRYVLKGNHGKGLQKDAEERQKTAVKNELEATVTCFCSEDEWN